MKRIAVLLATVLVAGAAIGDTTFNGKFVGQDSGLTNSSGSPVAHLSDMYAPTDTVYGFAFVGTNSPAFFGDAGALTNLDVWSSVVSSPYGSAFPLGTNTVLSVGGVTIGFSGVANVAATRERYGKATILATGGNVTFTNPASVHSSDFALSRVITNGNSAQMVLDVIPGQCTNLFIMQFK